MYLKVFFEYLPLILKVLVHSHLYFDAAHGINIALLHFYCISQDKTFN